MSTVDGFVCSLLHLLLDCGKIHLNAENIDDPCKRFWLCLWSDTGNMLLGRSWTLILTFNEFHCSLSAGHIHWPEAPLFLVNSDVHTLTTGLMSTLDVQSESIHNSGLCGRFANFLIQRCVFHGNRSLAIITRMAENTYRWWTLKS